MPNITAAKNYLRSFFQEPKQPLDLKDITCPITRGILIEPVKTNCGHHFEQLALATQLQALTFDNRELCSICRTRITSADLDHELIVKIQDQFVKLSIENKKIFDDQKTELSEDEGYRDVRSLPEIPRRSDYSTMPEEFRDLARFLESDFPRSPPRASSENSQRSDFFLRNAPRRLRSSISTASSLLSASRRSISGILSSWIIRSIKNNASNQFTNLYNLIITSNESLSQKVEQCIENDNLAQAEIYTSRISKSIFRDQCYSKIGFLYKNKANADLVNSDSYLTSSTRIARLISHRDMKAYLFKELAQSYIDADKLLQAKSIIRDDVKNSDKDELYKSICSNILLKEYSLSNVQEVLSIFPLMFNNNFVNHICRNLLNKCIANNDYDNAENAIEKLRFPYEIQAEYHKLSQLLINNNYSDLKRALNITDKIESYSIKNTNFEKISSKFADIRYFKDAYKTISKHTNPSTRKRLYFILTIKTPFIVLYSLASFPFRQIINRLKKQH
ncbi:MAG: hypothetical protein K940chlam5_00444 [Candidatus Anoxychlamydiales bacterium]|nr:hypothetical protein [Candidatus Anoxychlamydiales bacterium]